MTRSRPIEAQTTLGVPDHPRNEGKNFLEAVRRKRQGTDRFDPELDRFLWIVDVRREGIFDHDGFREASQIERDLKAHLLAFDEEIGDEVLVARKKRYEPVGSTGNTLEQELSFRVRDAYLGSFAVTLEGHDNTGQSLPCRTQNRPTHANGLGRTGNRCHRDE